MTQNGPSALSYLTLPNDEIIIGHMGRGLNMCFAQKDVAVGAYSAVAAAVNGQSIVQ